MKMSNVLYYDNCWMTNIGEAFIDIGARKLLENIGDNKIIVNSTMSQWYLNDINKKNTRRNCIQKFANGKTYMANVSDCFKLQDYFKPDYFVLAGMFASELMEESETLELLKYYKKYGTKIMFLGLGGEHYTEKERDYFSRILEFLKPEIVITRDKKTYEAYKDVIYCYQGIDCALWTREVYDPKGFPCNDYYLLTFNRIDEPSELEEKYGNKIIRPYHTLWGVDAHKKVVKREKLFLSDSPFDYLSLYANAKAVYTDMVHATLISLMYDVPVRYYHFDNRRDAFDSLPIISNGEFLKIDIDKLDIKKKEVENIVKSIICK